jgi:hypothetical protein
MKMRSTVGIVLCMLFASSSIILAHNSLGKPKGGGQAAASTASDSEKRNIEEYIALLRENVRQERAQLMGAVLQLTPDDAAKFWPIYDEYQAEIAKLNDARIQNVRSYASEYTKLSDDKADQLTKEDLNLRKQRDELLSKTYERVKQSLGAVTASRFLHIESQLELIIDLQLDSLLPTGD